MTNGVRVAHDDGLIVRLYFADLDAAVEFADWAARRGLKVEMFDAQPGAMPRTPEEAQGADALAEMFARSLATSAGA